MLKSVKYLKFWAGACNRPSHFFAESAIQIIKIQSIVYVDSQRFKFLCTFATAIFDTWMTRCVNDTIFQSLSLNNIEC